MEIAIGRRVVETKILSGEITADLLNPKTPGSAGIDLCAVLDGEDYFSKSV